MTQTKLETKLAWTRKMRGLSQGQLAKRSGVSVRVIQLAEQRQVRIDAVHAETLWRLATALETTMESLMEHDKEN